MHREDSCIQCKNITSREDLECTRMSTGTGQDDMHKTEQLWVNQRGDVLPQNSARGVLHLSSFPSFHTL